MEEPVRRVRFRPADYTAFCEGGWIADGKLRGMG